MCVPTFGKTSDVPGTHTLVVLAPHPDDAVLAVGGLIAHHSRVGGHTLIVTVFAGSPTGPAPPAARRLYSGHPKLLDIARTRRAEDLAAARQVGAQVVQLSHIDALLRTTPNGSPQYSNLEQIFSGPTTNAESIAERLAQQLAANQLLPANAEVLAPLGIGGHIDHWIVRRAAEYARCLAGQPTSRLNLYEDQPYTSRQAQHRWRHLIPQHSVPTVHPVTQAAWLAKIAAIACHTSQIPLLWPDTSSFGDDLRTYATTLGTETPSERTWSA